MGWFEVFDIRPRCTDLFCESLYRIWVIQDVLQAAQCRQKCYANRRLRALSFSVGDRVFYRVSPIKGVMRFRKMGKLNPRYIGPFEILRTVGDVTYELALPLDLSAIHQFFFMLRCYIPDESHVIHWDSIQLDERLSVVEEPISILARDVIRLHSRDFQ